jgi:type IV fimbrial biogenesis protein FimT
MMTKSQTHTPHTGGFTLIECMAALAVVSVLLGVGLQTWVSKIMHTRLDGHANELIQDIHWARSQAVARREHIRLRVQQHVASSCYVVHNGPANSCSCSSTGVAICQPGSQSFKVMHLPGNGQVSLSANVGQLTWDAAHGTTSPAGSLLLENPSGEGIKLIVNLTGRVRACVAGGAPAQGFPACAS